jgi:hypothetical protein
MRVLDLPVLAAAQRITDDLAPRRSVLLGSRAACARFGQSMRCERVTGRAGLQTKFTTIIQAGVDPTS